MNDNKNKNTKISKLSQLPFFPHLRVSNFHKWPLEVDGHGQRLALELICQETKYPVPFFHRQFFLLSWGNFSANARSGAACHCCWELCPDQTQRGFFPSLLFFGNRIRPNNSKCPKKWERKQKANSISGFTCHGASDGRLDSPVPWSSHSEVCTWIHNTHCYWCSGWL